MPMLPLATGETPVLDLLGKWGQKPNIKAVLFDIYGTLLISGSGDIGSSNVGPGSGYQVLAPYLGREMSEADKKKMDEKIIFIYKHVLERDREQKIKKGIECPEVNIVTIWQAVVGELNGPGSKLKMSEQEVKKIAFQFECLVNPVWPMPGLKKSLAVVSGEVGTLGIISNAQFYTPILMNYFLTGQVAESETIVGFDPELTFYSYKEQISKPSPRAFERSKKVLADRGIAAEETLFIGNDMLNDIYPAQRVGFQTCLYAGDRRSLRRRADEKRVQGTHPDYVITDLSQLGSIVAG